MGLASQTLRKEVETSSKHLQKSKKLARKAKKENTGWHEQIDGSKAAEEDLLTERASSALHLCCQKCDRSLDLRQVPCHDKSQGALSRHII